MRGGSGNMEKSYFWGVKLDSSNKEAKWDGTATENPEECTVCTHTLCVRQAVLGADAKEGEINVIEIETTGFGNKKIKTPICVMDTKGSRVVSVEVLLEDQQATFHLTKGSGPIYLSGSHQTETVILGDDDVDESLAEEEGEEEEDDEDEVDDAPAKKKARK